MMFRGTSSGMASSAQPPKHSNARACEAIRSGKACDHVASANV